MKDLDFDELDKAVNSLMSNVPKTAPVKSDDVKTLTIKATMTDDTPPHPSADAPSPSPVVATSVTASSEPTPAPVKTAVAAPSASLANRRGGRFMDVVHPSSDMKRPTPSQGPSRQGVTIEPRPSMPLTPAAADTTLVQSEEAMPPAVEMPVPTAEPQEDTANAANDWPDPLEMTSSQPEEVAVPPVPVETKPEASAASQDVEVAAQVSPMTSPFLTDAKVEKRPLGNAPTEKSEEPDHSPVLGVLAQEDATDDKVDDQLPPAPVESEAPLPEELSNDLMAVESDTHPINQTPETSATVPPAASSPTVTAQPAPAGPSSIPQQYKEEQSTGDQTSGAIFDTASYHQPLAHPAKKKTGWLWVIGVIIILLLGAAGGAAWYFLGIA